MYQEVYTKRRFQKDLEDFVKYGYSEAYIEAVLYGRYSDIYSIQEISKKITEEKLKQA